MDLGAYVQIEDLEDVAKKNGIKVPRLRGYRLMRDEKPVDIDELINNQRREVECCEELIALGWNPSRGYRCYGGVYDISKRKSLLVYDSDDEPVKVKWNKIHGRRRKMLKTFIHNDKQRITKQFQVWNKYVGRNDVLYIHAKIGHGNWSGYGCSDISQQPWYLESVEDWYDSVYVDIYAKIDPEV